MKLRKYINNLNDNELQAYAGRCGIAVSYLRIHVKYASKNPSVGLIRSLTRGSLGAISLADVLEHYNIIEEAMPPQAA